jgi:hypothetical protein
MALTVLGEWELIVMYTTTVRLIQSIHNTATASFGAPLSWSPDTKTALPEGHDMSFVEAITGVSENMFLTIAVPDVLLFNLPFKK